MRLRRRGLKLENSTPPTRVEQRYTVWQAIRHNWGFIGLHASVLTAFFVGVSWPALVACLGFYWMRVFFITGFYQPLLLAPARSRQPECSRP